MLRVIGGHHKGRKLKAPAGQETRPTTEGNRETLFNFLENALGHSMGRVLDLFAGSGALTCEAISRGAQSAVLIDSSKSAQKIISENIRSLDPQFPCRILGESRIERWPDQLLSLGESFLPFDTVFCDPPYGKDLHDRCFKAILRHRELWTPQTLICLEMSRRDSFELPLELEIRKERDRGESRLLVLSFIPTT